MEIRTIGIDLGKTVFHFVAVNARGTLFQCKMSLNGGIDSQYKMSLKG
jgi:hypothetical protein